MTNKFELSVISAESKVFEGEVEDEDRQEGEQQDGGDDLLGPELQENVLPGQG